MYLRCLDLRCARAAVLHQYRCILAIFELTRCVFGMLGVHGFLFAMLDVRSCVFVTFEPTRCAIAMLGVHGCVIAMCAGSCTKAISVCIRNV